MSDIAAQPDTLLETEDYYHEALRESFDLLSHDVVDAILADVISVWGARPEDALRRALKDASQDAHVARIAFDTLESHLESARDRTDGASPSFVALLHGTRGSNTSAYSDPRRRGPAFASVVRLDETPLLLLSRDPSWNKDQYLGSLWHHNVSVAVSLTDTDKLWPAAPQENYMFGGLEVTTLESSKESGHDLPDGVTIRTVRLRRLNGEEQRIATVWDIPWPDFGVLKSPAALSYLANRMRETTGSIAIHCGAGQGRSGSLALAIALAGQSNGPITLAAALRIFLQMRLQRQHLIETGKQFYSAIQSTNSSL